MTCGIYCITNLINGKQYVGQSVDMETRMNDHIHSDSNSKIHQAIVKYGVKNFRFEPLIRCSREELDEQEVKFIRLLNTYEKGYNQTRGGQHHVFNIEYNYENYSELKKKISDKERVISDLKQTNRGLELRIVKLNQIIKANNENESAKSDDIKIARYKQEINDLQNEKDTLYNETLSLQSEIGYLHKIIDSFKQGDLEKEIQSLSQEKNGLKRDIRNFKRDIRILAEKIEELEGVITQKDREIQILHERLGWQPKKNIFYEILEEKRSVNVEGK